MHDVCLISVPHTLLTVRSESTKMSDKNLKVPLNISGYCKTLLRLRQQIVEPKDVQIEYDSPLTTSETQLEVFASAQRPHWPPRVASALSCSH
jgi:hypothetical protein